MTYILNILSSEVFGLPAAFALALLAWQYGKEHPRKARTENWHLCLAILGFIAATVVTMVLLRFMNIIGLKAGVAGTIPATILAVIAPAIAALIMSKTSAALNRDHPPQPWEEPWLGPK